MGISIQFTVVKFLRIGVVIILCLGDGLIDSADGTQSADGIIAGTAVYIYAAAVCGTDGAPGSDVVVTITAVYAYGTALRGGE